MVFSVPGRVWWFPGCFQFPGWGVLGARGCFQFPEWCFRFPARGRHGGVCGSRTVFRVPVRVPPLLPLLLRCFFLLLLASLLSFASFLPSSFPHVLRFCLACCLFSFLSSVPAFPLPSLPPPALPLIFLRSFLFLLPALASFPSLTFPSLP